MALAELRTAFRDVRRDPRGTLSDVARSWISISLVASFIATFFDLAVVIALVQWRHFNPAAAAPIGVTFGSTVNFGINKIFSFKDSVGHLHYQYMRFLLGTAVAAAIHAGFVYVFTNLLGIHYVISKIAADILVFTVGNLVLLRFVVFPKNLPAECPRMAPRA